MKTTFCLYNSMTEIIDGRQLAATLQAALADQIAGLPPPKLVAILVGDDPASAVYVRRKSTVARQIGIEAETIHLSESVTQQAMLDQIIALNQDNTVHGILVQLPLPRHIATGPVVETLDPVKDVDGFHPLNTGRLAAGRPFHTPCTPDGVLRLLAASNRPLVGARALVIGCSQVVGQPTAIMLTRAGATVTIAHRETRDLIAECQRAEILVAAAGCPRLVRGDHIRPDATVIDVGITRVNGKLVGDVAFEECLGIARAITPVPGGVGPMTIACLMANTVRAQKLGRS